MLSGLAVFVGGGLGSLCRYGLTFLIPSASFPGATLAANVLACFVLGFLVSYWQHQMVSDTWKLLLGTGFCGGFSTFSTFSKELVVLQQEQLWQQMLYLILSLSLGIFAVCLGMWLAQWRENM